MGTGVSLCTYGGQVSQGNDCVAGADGPLPCPHLATVGGALHEVQQQAPPRPVECQPDMHTGYWAGQVLLNFIPFLGPSLAALWSPPSATQSSLQQAQVALAEAQCQLKSKATRQIKTLTTDICELEVTLFGTDQTCGYVQMVIEQASVPVYQRAALLGINVGFLCLIVVLLVLLL